MAGRRPKPTAVKALEGNPGHRPLNKSEPQPPPGAPTPPKHLTKEARAEWVRIATELDKLGLLTNCDSAAFQGYCEAYSIWVRAKAVVARKGMTFTAANGMVRKRPEVGIMEQAARGMRQYAAEFGLTPSSRSRVSATPMSPALPGADKWPEQRDPAKPALPAAGFTDDDYFNGGVVKH